MKLPKVKKSKSGVWYSRASMYDDDGNRVQRQRSFPDAKSKPQAQKKSDAYWLGFKLGEPEKSAKSVSSKADDHSQQVFAPPVRIERLGVRESFDSSVDAIGIDKVKAGGVIRAAQKIADIMDTPGWPCVEGSFDNVSPGMFLKYCSALGMDAQAFRQNGGASKLSSLKVKPGGQISKVV